MRGSADLREVRMTGWRRKLVRLALLATCAVSAAPKASAETIALSVSPPLIEMSLAQGGDRSLEVTVTNDGDRPFRAKAVVVDLTLNRNGDPLPGPSSSSRWSVAPWVALEPTDIEIRPGEQKKVRCRIRVPRGETGGRYGALLFAAARPVDLAGSGMKLETRTGTVLMLTVARTERRRAQVAELDVRSGEGPEVAIAAALRNDGNVHLRAAGEAVIRDGNNRVVARMKLDGGTGAVLPDGVRDFGARWDARRAKPGSYRLEVRFRASGLPAVSRALEFALPLVAATTEALPGPEGRHGG